MAKFSYDETIKKLRSTPKGKEASMYGPIRDIFIQLLGYSAADVDIDTIGEGGRPDVTARAPSGLLDSKGNALKIDWLVVEAKDENHCFTVATSRENIFEQKSKYITAHTAWFIMVEPDAWVLRPVAGNNLTSDADIIIDLTHDDVHEFIRKTESLHVNKAGVSHQLAKFREGDLRMIAVEKLSAPLGSQPTKRALNRIKLNRKRFFQQVREATSYLQSAVSGAFSR